jgi:hypothetical protein
MSNPDQSVNKGHRSVQALLAVSWEDHRRMSELCDWLGTPLQVMRTNHRGVRRYLSLSIQTLKLLSNQRPSAVFLQNPSLILAILVMVTRRFFGIERVVMDAHNEAVTPFTHAYWPITMLSRFALKHADATVVTNAALASIVSATGGRPLVLPDRLPSPPVEGQRMTAGPVISVMVVATFAADEPIADIVAAATRLGSGFSFAVTGNSKKCPRAIRDGLPANVRLTGFLPEHDYWQLMAESHVILDLTLKPDCLVCGAYEALALGKPMVLTGNAASRDLFGTFAAFPDDCSAPAIARTLDSLRSNYASVEKRTLDERPRFAERWNVAAVALGKALSPSQ